MSSGLLGLLELGSLKTLPGPSFLELYFPAGNL